VLHALPVLVKLGFVCDQAQGPDQRGDLADNESAARVTKQTDAVTVFVVLRNGYVYLPNRDNSSVSKSPCQQVHGGYCGIVGTYSGKVLDDVARLGLNSLIEPPYVGGRFALCRVVLAVFSSAVAEDDNVPGTGRFDAHVG
jgi:hypothetical protein